MIINMVVEPPLIPLCPLLGLIIMQINCLDLARLLGFSFAICIWRTHWNAWNVTSLGRELKNIMQARRLNMIITVPPHRNYQAIWGGVAVPLHLLFSLRLLSEQKMNGWPEIW